jgi:hypothetical protein
MVNCGACIANILLKMNGGKQQMETCSNKK